MSGLFLFANSCHDEVAKDADLALKSGDLEKKEVIDSVKSWFESNPEKNTFELLNWSDDIKWANALMMEIDSSVVIEVPIKLKGNYKVLVENDLKLNIEHRLLFIKENGTITSYMEYFISKKDLGFLRDNEKVNYSKKAENFEGRIVLENSKKEYKTIYYSENEDECAELKLKSALPTCIGLFELFSDGSRTLIYIISCDYHSSSPSSEGGASGGGGSYTVTSPQSCNCNVCPICGKCLELLKSVPVPESGGTTTTIVCEICGGHPVIDPNKPCAGDPIKNASIASSGASGQYGGTYGCVRQGGSNCSEGIYNKKHGGIDIYAPENSDLYSISAGKVSYVGYITDLGNCIQVTSSDNSTSILYAHLNSQSLAVGNDVKIGDKLGLTGKTGNANDPAIIPHVHIQIKVNGVATDPQPFLSSTFNSDGSVGIPCNN